MLKVLRIMALTVVLLAGASILQVNAATPEVVVLTAKGIVNPVMAGYIQRGIAQAEDNAAVACVIEIDTPGGLDISMRDIIQAFNSSTVPVVVYVYPPGARAASAGTYITMAASVAVMAPNTVIGAATPVALGGGTIPDDEKTKIINDAAAYIRSIANAHGRNAEWAEKAVRDGISATEQEALNLHVVDMIAPDLTTLISRLDGRQVTLLDGKVVTLSTQDAVLNFLGMNWAEGILAAISDPTVAYILMALGMLGILVEFFTPGFGLPGIAGAICLILALFSLGTLSVNWAGVLFIMLAFALFVAEALTPGFGLFFTGGIISLILGSLLLFQGGPAYMQISPWVIALVIIIIGGFVAFAAQRVMQANRRQPTTGLEEFKGKTVIVKEALTPEGMVLHEGELWRAVLDQGRAEPGEEVVINKIDGMKLYVTKKEQGGK